MFCLESAWKSAKEGPRGSHVYTKALLAYAFALAGNQEKRSEVLKSLDEEAVKEGERAHLKSFSHPIVPISSTTILQKSPTPTSRYPFSSLLLSISL